MSLSPLLSLALVQTIGETAEVQSFGAFIIQQSTTHFLRQSIINQSHVFLRRFHELPLQAVCRTFHKGHRGIHPALSMSSWDQDS